MVSMEFRKSTSVLVVLVMAYQCHGMMNLFREMKKGPMHKMVDFMPDDLIEKMADKELEDMTAAGKGMKKVGVSIAKEMTESLPLVGHVTGTVHYICGNNDAGDRCMKKASRALAVTGAAIAVAATGGAALPAAVAAVSAGLAADGVTTGVDSAVKGKYVPSGVIADCTEMHYKRMRGENISLNIASTGLGVLLDGLGGKSVGNCAKSIQKTIAKDLMDITAKDMFKISRKSLFIVLNGKKVNTSELRAILTEAEQNQIFCD